MSEVEGIAWAQKVLGELGPHIRTRAPHVLVATHGLYAAYQDGLGLASADPYGLMWLGVPRALVAEFSGVPGVRTHRPRYGRYHLPLINGVPLIPWRYAKTNTVDIDRTPFGHPLSQSRKTLFEPPDLHPELPLGNPDLGELLLADLTPQQRSELDHYGQGIRALASDHPLVAVLAYASNPDALLRCYLGYARLGEHSLLDWSYREELVLAAADQPVARVVLSRDPRPAFDDGVPQSPVLRPRSPLAPAPTPQPPVTPEETGSGA